MGQLDGPLPLVTLTLTTDEIAMCSAGLMLLRSDWNSRAMGIAASGGDVQAAQKIIQQIGFFIQRLQENVTEEQGRTLLSELIQELRRKPQ